MIGGVPSLRNASESALQVDTRLRFRATSEPNLNDGSNQFEQTPV